MLLLLLSPKPLLAMSPSPWPNRCSDVSECEAWVCCKLFFVFFFFFSIHFFLFILQEGPGEAAVAALGEATETPERLWTADMRATAAEEVAHLAEQAHAAQVHPAFPPPFHAPLLPHLRSAVFSLSFLDFCTLLVTRSLVVICLPWRLQC